MKVFSARMTGGKNSFPLGDGAVLGSSKGSPVSLQDGAPAWILVPALSCFPAHNPNPRRLLPGA